MYFQLHCAGDVRYPLTDILFTRKLLILGETKCPKSLLCLPFGHLDAGGIDLLIILFH